MKICHFQAIWRNILDIQEDKKSWLLCKTWDDMFSTARQGPRTKRRKPAVGQAQILYTTSVCARLLTTIRAVTARRSSFPSLLSLWLNMSCEDWKFKTWYSLFVNVKSELINNTKQSHPVHAHTHTFHGKRTLPSNDLAAASAVDCWGWFINGAKFTPPAASRHRLRVLSPFAHSIVSLLPFSLPLSQPCSLQQYAAQYGWVHLRVTF